MKPTEVFKPGLVVSLLIVVGLASSACGLNNSPAEPSAGGGQEEPADEESTAEQPVIAATATRIPYDGPTGGVSGTLLWNGRPAAGVQVRLCEDIEFLGGCVGQEYWSETDENGVYLFSDVIPMSYALVYHALDTDDWVYVSSAFFNARKFDVVGDQEINFGELNIIKYDVNLVAPQEDSQLTEARPTLQWEAYSEAAYYEIYLTQSPGKAIFVSYELSETSIAPTADLLTCEYTWDIEVYNSQGVQIAETDGYWHFEVTGQPYDCYVTGLTPGNGSVASGQNLVLNWNQHSLARSYHVTLKNSDDGTVILDFVQTDTNSYTLSENLPSGNYEWYVAADDQSGDYFAQSDTYTFVVQ